MQEERARGRARASKEQVGRVVFLLRLMEETIAVGGVAWKYDSPVMVLMPRGCVSCVRMTHGFHEAALIIDSQAYTLIAAGVDHTSSCEVACPSPTLTAYLSSPYIG